jgi:hypothetical protein
MSREVAGSEPDDAARPAPIVDIDLGEIGHAPPPDEPGPHPRLRLIERFAQVRALHRQTLAAIGLVALLAAAVGWQVGGTRERAAVAARNKAKPPVLAWLVYDGPDLSSTPQRATAHMELFVANLGQQPITLRSISSTGSGDAVRAGLATDEPLTISPGGNGHTSVVVREDCTATYTSATLHLAVTSPGTGSTRMDVPTSSDGTIGTPYLMALNQLCITPRSGEQGGVDGVFVDSTSAVQGAVLVLTNNTDGRRQVSFATLESDGFRIEASPAAPLTLAPGAGASVLLTFKVTSCKSIGRISNFASGVSMQVRSPDEDLGNTAALDPPAEMGLRDLVLAPLGAAVQKACG